MEAVQDWAMYALQQGGPYLVQLNPYLSQLHRLSRLAQSWLNPIIYQVTNKPDLTTVVLLLVILFLSLKILNVMWQAVLFWLRMARRIAFWGGLAAIGLWFWTRGPEGVVEDVQYWGEVWSNEHKYWQDRGRAAKLARSRSSRGNSQRAWF